MPDFYKSLGSLKRNLQRDVDYRIVCKHHRSWATIISPHGGYIECGTSAIAEAIAGEQYSVFDFQALQHRDAQRLHITSTRFRHPTLTRMLKRSFIAVSVHGMGYCGHRTIWLGGRNQFLKQLAADCLRDHGFSVEENPPLWQGQHPKNLVNCARYQGLQLELPTELIDTFFRNRRKFSPKGRKLSTSSQFASFVCAIRVTLQKYRDDINRGRWDE